MTRTHIKQKRIKVHMDLMTTLKEKGKSMKKPIFFRTDIKLEENSKIKMLRTGNKVISIVSITGNKEYNH